VTDTYQGAFCHGRNFLETIDTLDTFNEAVKSLECTRIYSASNGDYYEAPDDEDDHGYDFEEMSAVTLLSFSKSCSLRQYPHDCPDPYGLKKKYSKSIERAFAFSTGSQRNIGVKIMKAFSWIFLFCGLVCWVLSYKVLKNTREARRESRSLEKKRSREEKRRSRSKDGKPRSKSKDSKPKSRVRSLSPATSTESQGSIEKGMEKVGTAVSELSHKSWTAFGQQDAKGESAKASSSSKDGTKKSGKGKRIKNFFQKKDQPGDGDPV